MRARIGDLAIVRFDNKNCTGYDEQVCIVMGGAYCKDEYSILYWEKKGRTTEMISTTMPRSRLMRARPYPDEWDGTLGNLTIHNVELV
ncbi:hypothetical protein LCGC14_0142680 [marine sediment metagenome]|uniref:Uncharacterized protein n=1 Tax=marine sediment metagenome TaxID=412755 RepID=A0A0F9Y2W2_9ZZZZ